MTTVFLLDAILPRDRYADVVGLHIASGGCRKVLSGSLRLVGRHLEFEEFDGTALVHISEVLGVEFA